MRRTPARQRTFMEHRAIQYQTWEAAFIPTDAPRDPFRDAVFRVEITNPYGDVRWREGFPDGGVWRLRWMPLEEGPHHLRFETNLGGLPESLGLVVEEATWPQPGFRHPLSTSGPLRVADEATHFARHDGTPFFLKCEETYSVPSRATDAEWRGYCERRAAGGLTGASLATDLQRFFAPPEGEEALSDPAFRPDLAYLARLDRRIETLNAHGLVAIPHLFRLITVAHPRNVHHGADLDDVVSVADAIRLGRYFVARWGAYDLLWFLGLPGGADEDAGIIEVTAEIGRGIFGDDPWRFPVAVDLKERELLHPIMRDEPWIGWIASRSHGHWIEPSLRWIWNDYAAEAASDLPRPHVNLDPVVYGDQWAVNDPASARSARSLVYASLFAVPPAGAGYTMRAVHDWRRAARDAASSEQGPTWIEALEDPSAEEFGMIDAKLSKHHWSDLRPAPELLGERSGAASAVSTIGVLANSDRSTIRVYVPQRQRFRLADLAGTYEAYWVSLRYDGPEVTLPDVTGGAEFESPDDEDWILQLDAI